MSIEQLRRSFCSVVVNVLDCNIKVSELKLQSCYYVYFQINTPEKGMNSLILHRYCFSRRMALALNNPQRLICH